MGLRTSIVDFIGQPWNLFTVLIVLLFGACANGGWRVLTTDPAMHILPIIGLASFDVDRVWAMTPYELLRTYDGGDNWTTVLTGDERSFLSLTFANPATGWIVGGEGQYDDRRALIMHTTDGGKNWDRQEAKSVPLLTSVGACDATTGWALGPKDIIHTA